MRFELACRTLFLLVILFASPRFAAAQAETAGAPPADAATDGDSADHAGGPELLLPENIGRVPEGNDFDDPESEFSHARSRQSEHFALFWAKEYGDDPTKNEDEGRTFDPDRCIAECERYYDYYVNTLKWVDAKDSFAAKYKLLIFVIGGPGGTAFGGSIDNKIGAFWTPATRINREPYGVMAHELGHSFQALLRADGGGGLGGGVNEMLSQYMLWQVYPEWMTFENYHLVDFMRQTHLAFLHNDNIYHSCYPLEYWSNIHGVEFMGKLWREAERGEDPVLAYKRITGISQEKFNDEMFDACRRFVTWDMPRIEKVAARYANQHETKIAAGDDGWFKITAEKCPQNYGYNAIRLNVPDAGTKVGLEFEGLVGAEGFNSVQPEKAGWRYGLLAHLKDGSRVYSDTFRDAKGTSEFTVPADTEHLWLVVMGAPTEHWVRQGGRGGGGRRRGRQQGQGQEQAEQRPAGDEQWPYQFKLEGTTPHESTL
jgi:hypothetical protein